MERIRLWVVAGVLLALWALSAQGITLSVNPTNLSWNESAWVAVTMGGLASGDRAGLRLVGDANRNGVADANELCWLSLEFQDGVTNLWGAASMPSDDDGLANGVISTRVPYHRIYSPLHAIGSYVWVATNHTGGGQVSASFAVTQPTNTIWIEGRVVNAQDESPIAGALAGLEPFSYALHLCPSALTDTNGNFRIHLPAGWNAGEVAGVWASAPGYLTADTLPSGEPLSSYGFTNALSVGANALTNDLRAVPYVPGMTYRVSGQVYDAHTNPLHGAMVFFSPEDDENEDDIGMFALSDASGAYTLVVPEDLEGFVHDSGIWLNMRGLVAARSDTLMVTQDVAGVDLYSPVAVALARNTVADRDDGTPVAGAEVFFGGEDWESTASTLEDGRFEIGIFPEADGTARMEEDSINVWGWLGPKEQGGLTFPASGVYTDVIFRLERGGLMSGVVHDLQTNRLTGGYAGLFHYPRYNAYWEQSMGVNFFGEFGFLVQTGAYAVGADGFIGYLGQRYTNHYNWEWSEEGVVADPVVVTTAGVANVNFYLPPAALIRGTVRGTNQPIEGVWVSASVDLWDGRAWTSSDAEGNYVLQVPPDEDYVVRADPPNDGFWLEQYFNGKTSAEDADVVHPTLATPAEGIDFDLEQGGRLEGMLYETDGITPVTNQSFGFVEAHATNESNSFVAEGERQRDGSYGFPVPAGIYRVYTANEDWLPQYHHDVFEYQQELANVVTVRVLEVTTVDFALRRPSYIRGRVTYGGSDVEGQEVNAFAVTDTNHWSSRYLSSDESDADGFYALQVPPGTNFLVGVQEDETSYFLPQYWSNATQESEATLLAVGETAAVDGINFELVEGLAIEGQVRDENGNPVQDADVGALRWTTNGHHEWVRGTSADNNGNYRLLLDPSTSYVVRAGRPWYVDEQDWWKPEQYYAQVYTAPLAEELWTNAGHSLQGVDFDLQLGYLAMGQVYLSDGTTPASFGWVEAVDASGHFYAMDMCDYFTGYSVLLPTNVPLHLFAGGDDCVPEYYSNTYDRAQASSIQASAMTTTHVFFVLYTQLEDSDGDGIPDWQEDSRPDGVFIPAQDWASYTNRDTDGDQFGDQEEWVCRSDPQNAEDYLRWGLIRWQGHFATLSWPAASGVWYAVESADNLMAPNPWSSLGYYYGTGSTMTVTDFSAEDRRLYRVTVDY